MRKDGCPHTSPVWFCLLEDTCWIASAARDVKVHNLATNPHLSLALQDRAAPVVAESRAIVHTGAFPAAVVAAFAIKYSGQDITDHRPYGPRVLLQVLVSRCTHR